LDVFLDLAKARTSKGILHEEHFMQRDPVDEAIETDVLIIGGGIAGSRAAIEAKRNNAHVLMIVKGIYGVSGCSISPAAASAIGPWSDPRDSVERHLKDIVVNAKQFLCDQELARIQAIEGGERLLELEKWGVFWDRDADGRISLFPSSTLGEPGQAPVDRWITISRRGTHAEGPFWTGHETVDALRDQVNREKIPYFEDTMVSRVLVTDNNVTGAIAYDYLNSRIILIKCPVVIIATGDASQVYFPHTMVSGESTGDGFALAYEAGGQLADLEQFEYMTFDFAYPDSAMGKAALENVGESGEKAYLRNKLGERFMERYNPEGKEWSNQAELARAMWQEVSEGRGGPHGGVFLDLRHIPRAVVERSAPEKLEHIEKTGYNIRKDMIEVYPAIHTNNGGIRIDSECHTRVHGLFAAGQVAFAVGDCLVEGGTGIVDALVWGKRAGEFAAIQSHASKQLNPSVDDVREEIRRLRAPLEVRSGIPPIKIMRRLQRAMWEGASIVKNEDELKRTLAEIEEIQETMLGQMSTNIKSGKFNHEMREAVELRHMLTVSEMIVRSSIMRKESRNRFQRSDYPEKDDKNWLKHILVEKTASGMKLTTIPVEFPYVKRE
jgi:fumarate reductase (CoM/CoB) subunit A